MKKIILFCLVAMVPIIVYSQKGTLKNLDNKMGFKSITLGAPISKYYGKVKIMRDSKDMYDVTDSTLLYIGNDIKLKFILIKTYNDSIFSINIFAKPNDSERIISIFNNAYGDYSKISTSDKYFWYGEKVELVLDDSDSRWCLSVFTDRKLQFSKETKDYKNVKKDSDDI